MCETSLAQGITIRFENGAMVDFGNHVRFNKNAFILSRHGVAFGEDVLFGWNVMVLDDDGHKTI